MLRNFGTVCRIFTKIASKFAEDFKEKSPESSRYKKNFHKIIAENIEGGGDTPLPRPF